MKRIMYFHLFQSNNPVLPVEYVDSRISLVTTLGWISRVQLLPPFLSLSLSPCDQQFRLIFIRNSLSFLPSPLNKASQQKELS